LKRRRIIVRNLAEAARRIRDAYRERLRERFGPGGDEEELEYHTPRHSEDVATSARAFLELVRTIDPSLVSELDLELVEIEGLAHDSVQKSTLVPGRERLRHRGYRRGDIPSAVRRRGVAVGNELASAKELLEELERYETREGRPVFPIDDPAFRAEVADDIGATFPEIDSNARIEGMRGSKVYQPHLTPKSSLRALAVATADLRGTLGSASDPRLAMKQGDAEFREVRADLKTAVARGIDRIPRSRRGRIARDVLHWWNDQVVFAKWQHALFLDSLERNERIAQSPRASAIRQALRKKHSAFDRNIAALRRRAKEMHVRYGELVDPPRLTRASAHASRDRFRDLLTEIGYRL